MLTASLLEDRRMGRFCLTLCRLTNFPKLQARSTYFVWKQCFGYIDVKNAYAQNEAQKAGSAWMEETPCRKVHDWKRQKRCWYKRVLMAKTYFGINEYAESDNYWYGVRDKSIFFFILIESSTKKNVLNLWLKSEELAVAHIRLERFHNPVIFSPADKSLGCMREVKMRCRSRSAWAAESSKWAGGKDKLFC